MLTGAPRLPVRPKPHSSKTGRGRAFRNSLPSRGPPSTFLQPGTGGRRTPRLLPWPSLSRRPRLPPRVTLNRELLAGHNLCCGYTAAVPVGDPGRIGWIGRIGRIAGRTRGRRQLGLLRRSRRPEFPYVTVDDVGMWVSRGPIRCSRHPAARKSRNSRGTTRDSKCTLLQHV